MRFIVSVQKFTYPSLFPPPAALGDCAPAGTGAQFQIFVFKNEKSSLRLLFPLSSAHEKDIFAFFLVGFEPPQAMFGGMTSLLYLGFHFHAADEHHLDPLLGFYDDALQDLADHGIVIGERMVLHAIEDGKDIVQSGRRILPVLLGGCVLRQFLFKLAFLRHQIRNAGIGEKLLLIFGGHAVQQAFEFLIDLCNADLYFDALVLSGPGTEAQLNVLLERLQDIRVDLRCF